MIISTFSDTTYSDEFLTSCGILMGSVASFINCVGLNLQKLSLCSPENVNIPPHLQSKWLFGLACVISGSIIDFLAFGLAPQSLLAPLAALSLVFNLFMANYLLNERYTRKDLLATVTIFFGTGISVSNAPHKEVVYDLSDLLSLWNTQRMVVYVIVVPLLLGLHFSFLAFTDPENQKDNLDGIIVHSRKHRLMNFLRMAGYAGFAGIVGGQSLLFAKSVVELVKSAFRGHNPFWHLQTYVIIVMLVICLLVQVHFLNNALKNYDSLYVMPVYQSYWIFAGVIGGLVYFGEWDAMSANGSRMFVLGILVTFSGLLILTTRKHETKDVPALMTQISSDHIEAPEVVRRRSAVGDDTPRLELGYVAPQSSGGSNSNRRKGKNIYEQISTSENEE